MRLDRPSLKMRAVEIIRGSQPKVIYVAMAYVALTVLIGVLSARLMGVNYTQSDVEQFTEYASSGNYDYAMDYLETMKPPFTSYALDGLLTVLSSIVGAGFIIFLLNTIRCTGPCYGNLLDGFGVFLRIIILNLLEAVFIGLWSLLLVVPGIIAAYRYSMAIYLLLDRPELSPMACIAESSRLMSGHKMELFVLDLSFIGWSILASLPVLGYLVRVWSVPYIGMSKALYYEQLRGADISGGTRYDQPPLPMG